MGKCYICKEQMTDVNDIEFMHVVKAGEDAIMGTAVHKHCLEEAFEIE